MSSFNKPTKPPTCPPTTKPPTTKPPTTRPPTTRPPTTRPPTTRPPTTRPPTTRPPVTAPPCQSELFWLVEPGDTIYLVARETGTTVTQLIRLNPHLNPNNLQPGTRICLP